MMTMKMHVNESEMLTQTRSTALKKMNETMKCTKNCLTNMDPHGTRQNLRLWARCICTELHSSYEDPPDLPAFKEPETKKRKESLTEALAGAAVAFASAMSGGNQKQEVCRSGASHLESSTSVAVSPGKAVEL